MSSDNLEIIENQVAQKENIKEYNDNSFNQLFNLQLLIQKHNGFKELCKLI